MTEDYLDMYSGFCRKLMMNQMFSKNQQYLEKETMHDLQIKQTKSWLYKNLDHLM